MTDFHPTQKSNSWVLFVIEQAAWLLLSAVGAWAALVIRLVTLDLFFFLRVSVWSISAFDKTATIIIFFAWLIGSAWLQYVLSTSGSIQKLIKHSLIIFGIEILALGLSSLVRLFLS